MKSVHRKIAVPGLALPPGQQYSHPICSRQKKLQRLFSVLLRQRINQLFYPVLSVHWANRVKTKYTSRTCARIQRLSSNSKHQLTKDVYDRSWECSHMPDFPGRSFSI